MDSICEVEVTRLVPFGAFVKLSDEVEGLIHVSELAPKHIDNPAQVVHLGDKIQAKVVGINEDKHRISLSMRAAAEELGFEIEIEEILPENVTARKRNKKAEDSTEGTEDKSEIEDTATEEAEVKEEEKKEEKEEEKIEEPKEEEKAEEPKEEKAEEEKKEEEEPKEE